jgi:hypothetical protein
MAAKVRLRVLRATAGARAAHWPRMGRSAQPFTRTLLASLVTPLSSFLQAAAKAAGAAAPAKK